MEYVPRRSYKETISRIPEAPTRRIMSTLRFRAWHQNRMIPFKELILTTTGDFWKDRREEGQGPNYRLSCSADNTYRADGYNHDDFQENAEDYILMQSTGLKDSKGVEIFEGDIVKFGNGTPEGMIYKVEYCDDTFTNEFVGVNNSERHFLCNKQEPKEIIGNVYEHPDLLPPNDDE